MWKGKLDWKWDKKRVYYILSVCFRAVFDVVELLENVKICCVRGSSSVGLFLCESFLWLVVFKGYLVNL